MATEIENYPSETAMRAATRTTASRFKTGWGAKKIIRNNDNTWTIHWNNDPSIVPPKRQVTTPELLQEVADLLGVDLI